MPPCSQTNTHLNSIHSKVVDDQFICVRIVFCFKEQEGEWIFCICSNHIPYLPHVVIIIIIINIIIIIISKGRSLPLTNL